MVRDEEEGQRQSMKNKEESDRKTQDEKKKKLIKLVNGLLFPLLWKI